MSKTKETIEAILQLKNLWSKKKSLWMFIILVTIPFITKIYKSIDLSKDKISEIFYNKILYRNITVIYGVILIGIIIIWIISHRRYKFRKNETGIVITIQTDNDNEKKKIKKDFINSIRDEIEKSNVKNICVKIIEDEYAEIFQNKKKLKKISKSMNARLVIFGDTSQTTKQGDNYLSIRMHGYINFPRKSKTIEKEEINKDFTSFLQEDTLIDAKNEFLDFKFNSKYVAYISQYILGIVFYYSDKNNEAKVLLKQVITGLHSENEKVREKITSRVTENSKLFFADAVCKIASKEYIKSFNYSALYPYIQELDTIYPNYYRGCLVKSIFYFFEGNIAKSKETLLIAEKNSKKDGTWACNIAFLFAFEGNISEAFRYYEIGLRKVSNGVISECTKFIEYVISKNSEKEYLYFFEGLLFFSDKDFKKKAIIAYKKFIESEKQHPNYPRLVYSARKQLIKLGA